MQKTKINTAQAHVAAGRAIVARQRELVERIQERHGDPTAAITLLEQFEKSLKGFEDDLAIDHARVAR